MALEKKKGKLKTGKSFPVPDSELSFPHAFLLAASAGSGKTYNLSNRYIQFLLSPVIKKNSLPGLLAITFTENATKEMKGRIIKFLKEIYINPEKRKEMERLISLKGPELAERADEALNLIFSSYPDFNVGTIDSFILKILSVSVSELGIAPDYEVVFDNSELVDAVLRRFLDSFVSDEGRETAEEFLREMNDSGGDRFVFNPMPDIRKNFSQFMEKENKYLMDIKTVSADFKKHSELRKKIIENMIKMAEGYKEFRRFWLSGVEEALNNKDYSSLMNLYNQRFGFYDSRKVSKENGAEGLKKEVENINSMLREYYLTESAVYYRAFAELYIKFKQTFYRQRRRDRSISLSQITADISRHIKESSAPEIYLKLASQLNHFLIDEFQDTNLAQWDILRPLVEDSLSRYGSLFLIGDIKQAIYMFRNADYRIMGDFLSGDGQKYLNTAPLESGVENFPLSYNYRSAGRIISYVNSFFSSQDFKNYIEENIGKDFTGLLNSAQEVIPEMENKGYVRTAVIQAKRGEGDDELKNKFLEAAKDIVSRFSPENVAVLVKKNDEVEKVVSWLSEANIQAASFSSLDIRKRKVIAELRDLLAFLDNPSDNFSFGSFISGEIFSLAAGEKNAEAVPEFIFKAAREKKLLYAAFRESFPKLWENLFDELFSKSGYLTCYELINIALARFSVYENFSQETAFLVKLADIAYSLNSRGTATLSSLICELDNGSRRDEKFSVRLPEFVPAVKVMTFHKAKGLGFGAVINIFDQNSWHGAGGDRIYYSQSKDGLELRKITSKMADLIEELEELKNEDKKDEEIQNLNTLYVALTRAEREMVNIVKRPETSKKFFSLFKDFESGKKESFTNGEEKKPDYLELKARNPKKVYDFIRHGEGDSLETLRGNVYHRALSEIKDMSCADEKNISVLIDRACSFYGLHWEEEKSEALKKIMITVKTLQEYFTLGEGRNARSEVEFTGEKGRVFRIDRLVEDRHQAFVIDYKTGLPSDYSWQIKNYVKTVSAALGKPVKGIIYYIDSGELVEF
ncbi:MAG: UvrD-helicase domain-containing protein [Elusimicrobiota bacterium]